MEIGGRCGQLSANLRAAWAEARFLQCGPLDLRRRAHQLVRTMDMTDDEQAFLRDLVKASRQKLHHVKWIDRDGTERQTALTQTEVVRLNIVAQRLGTSKSEVLRRAAHIPVPKP